MLVYRRYNGADAPLWEQRVVGSNPAAPRRSIDDKAVFQARFPHPFTSSEFKKFTHEFSRALGIVGDRHGRATFRGFGRGNGDRGNTGWGIRLRHSQF
jgi:hypothetical protein